MELQAKEFQLLDNLKFFLQQYPTFAQDSQFFEEMITHLQSIFENLTKIIDPNMPQKIFGITPNCCDVNGFIEQEMN